MREKSAPDLRIAAVATRQHGVISIRQLRELGLTDTSVQRRRRVGRLHRLHRGVYAVGHTAPSNERRWMAAVLALSGDAADARGAVLSHWSAAALWRLLPAAAGPIDVSLPGRGGRQRRQGIRVHRPASLSDRERACQWSIPTTTAARTIADLRAVAPADELRRAIRQADVLGLTTGLESAPDRTRSELEHRFLRLCRRHGLPRPAVNIRIGSLIVDFCWQRQALIVETDGYRYHRGRTAFEDDRSRDLQLRALGYQVVRLSHRQVVDEPTRVAAALRRALGAAAGAPF